MDYAKFSSDPVISDLVKLSTANLKQLTVVILKNGLRACEQSTSGKKADLVQRLSEICQGIREYQAQASQSAQNASSAASAPDATKKDVVPENAEGATAPVDPVNCADEETESQASPNEKKPATSTPPIPAPDVEGEGKLEQKSPEAGQASADEPVEEDPKEIPKESEKNHVENPTKPRDDPEQASPATDPKGLNDASPDEKDAVERAESAGAEVVTGTDKSESQSATATSSETPSTDVVSSSSAEKEAKEQPDVVRDGNKKAKKDTPPKKEKKSTKNSPEPPSKRITSANVVDDEHEDVELDYGDEATTSEAQPPEKSRVSTSGRSKRSSDKRDSPVSKRSRTENASKNSKRDQSDQGKPRRWLFISNLRRPFTTRRLRTMLEEFGTIVDGDHGLMHDRFKTCCYVQFTSETDTRAAGKRLSGVVWPEETGQPLQTEIRAQNHLLEQTAPTGAAGADGARSRRGDASGGADASRLARVQRNSINNDLTTAAVPPPPPPRARGGVFDRISAPASAGTRDRDRASGVRGRGSVHDRLGMHADARDRRRDESADDAARSGERRRRSDRDADNSRARRDDTGKTSADNDESKPAAAVDALELLFKKTKTQPPLYWLPLTDEQIATKKAEAAALEKAREERRRERDKKEEEERRERSRRNDRRDRSRDRRDRSRSSDRRRR
eukprot:m.746528 g.746528  ORF g.746528 m.746528 type:complete len:677 (-) comp23137_c0_seq1:202-2232(-)